MKWMKGVSGIAWNKDFILIQIAPPFFDENSLKNTVAHEYHHSVFFENNDNSSSLTLLEEVMLEGRADTFARLMYPSTETPWSDFSSQHLEETTWKAFRENLNSTDASIKDDFFYGNSSRGIPDRSSYKIGNKIMDRFIQKNPDVSIAEWTEMSADEILNKSKFEELNNG
ncbi:hypothetical protein GCM10008986_31720 [Salinibacillus aidingensis]|uniref:DUF2268 domain-containing protein n=2 Tax=Salinibacillus aidingensis TaxID=237684 RepID=A0ABP3LKD1_9BACI